MMRTSVPPRRAAARSEVVHVAILAEDQPRGSRVPCVVDERRERAVAPGTGAIRDLPRLEKLYGKGRWRQMKGKALMRLPSGRVRLVELHWYEAHGIGRRELKRKRYLPSCGRGFRT